MLNSMMNMKNILLGILFSLIGIIASIVCEFLSRNYSWNLASDSISLAMGLVYLFLAWTIGNHISYTYRKQNSYYSGKLPEEIRDKVYNYRAPLLNAAIIDIVASLILFNIFQTI